MGRGRGRTIFRKMLPPVVGVSAVPAKNSPAFASEEQFSDPETTVTGNGTSEEFSDSCSSVESSSSSVVTSTDGDDDSLPSGSDNPTTDSDTEKTLTEYQYEEKSALTANDIKKIRGNKPQNFNQAQARGKIPEDFTACIYGCGTLIRTETKYMSVKRQHKNPYKLAHNETCIKLKAFNESMGRYSAARSKMDDAPPTPAVYDENCVSEKSDVGFCYGIGPFVAKKKGKKKKTEKMSK